jgi:hypothetical protein
MEPLLLDFLSACNTSVELRQPLMADLAASLGVTPGELGYFWAARRCKQRGSFNGGEWVYYFHGQECDIWQATDKRFLRLDFGPRSILTAFTVTGVTQFVMKACPPWDEFPTLKLYLATKPPPYDIYAGSLERAGELYDRLEQAGLVGIAAPDLVEFAQRYTSVNTEGLTVVQLPPDTSDRTWFDVGVAHRKVITDKGRSLLAALKGG